MIDPVVRKQLKEIANVASSINKKLGEDVTVANLDEVKLYLQNGLFLLAKNIQTVIGSIKFPKTYKVEEIPQLQTISKQLSILNTFTGKLDNIQNLLQNLKLNPQINVEAPTIPEIIIPEIKLPRIIIPKADAPHITVNPEIEINISGIIKALQPLLLLSDKAGKPLSVRLSNGTRFIEQLGALVKEQKKFASLYIPGNSSMTKSEYKRAMAELYIGSSATNSKVSILNSSTPIVAVNKTRVSLTLCNDSNTVIYISKAATAVMNQGIRLNANGGSLIFTDYNGAVAGISSVTGKNLTICEV